MDLEEKLKKIDEILINGNAGEAVKTAVMKLGWSMRDAIFKLYDRHEELYTKGLAKKSPDEFWSGFYS